jgi:two-component system copper resistance phosphate regulon response regulator CusR
MSTNSESSPTVRDTGPHSILLVEDENLIAALLASLLETEGYNVTIALDGSAGLDAATTTRFDLIISDVMMPGLNGTEMCQIIQKPAHQAASRETPIIFVTSTAVKPNLGCNYATVLAKPFEIETLLSTVNRYLLATPT